MSIELINESGRKFLRITQLEESGASTIRNEKPMSGEELKQTLYNLAKNRQQQSQQIKHEYEVIRTNLQNEFAEIDSILQTLDSSYLGIEGEVVLQRMSGRWILRIGDNTSLVTIGGNEVKLHDTDTTGRIDLVDEGEITITGIDENAIELILQDNGSWAGVAGVKSAVLKR